MQKPIISDSIIKWVPYNRKEQVCSRFPLDVWHNAVRDIDSDKEWADFLEESLSVKCYILKLCSNNKSIAFVYTIQEEFSEKVLSIHGGGWKSSLTHYRGYILMIKYLLDQGHKVRTYCQLSNPTAIRFDRSVGFVPYRYTEEEVFMWISRKRLESSRLYKRFYKQ